MDIGRIFSPQGFKPIFQWLRVDIHHLIKIFLKKRSAEEKYDLAELFINSTIY